MKTSLVTLVLAILLCCLPVHAMLITDTVIADGKEWAQPDLFTSLSWNDINAVCPVGECVAGGMLNGYTMTNWNWADTDDVQALFNYYIGSPELGPGVDSYSEFPGVFASAFFADGWRPTQHLLGISSDELLGLMSDSSSTLANVATCCDGGVGSATTGLDINASSVIAPYGAWFYRSDIGAGVDEPATLVLLGLGLAGLGWMRRN